MPSKWFSVFCSLVFLPVLPALTARAQRSVPAATGDARVDLLLRKMTLEEKILLTHGMPEDASTSQGQAGYLPGIPRLGIPSLRFADGPPGVLTRIPAAAPTCAMGLAATFDRNDARQNGILIGREARARGIDVVLEPFINMHRDLSFVRSYNTFGEDPLLTSQIGASEIQGIQSQDVMAQAKHYLAYDSQAKATPENVYPSNFIVGPQALHEIYLAPFAAAVNAGVSSFMCAYDKVNGEQACGNADILNTILRGELGFKGFVTSDWGATHATTYINKGLDMEMPGPIPMLVAPGKPQTYFLSYFLGAVPATRPAIDPTLTKMTRRVKQALPEEPTGYWTYLPPLPPPSTDLFHAVRSGLVSEATVTRSAGRVLYEMDRFGYLDHPPSHKTSPATIIADARIIQKTGEDAAVLLKNDGALPLTSKDIQSLALIGPGAGQTIAVGMQGEKAVGLPGRQIGTFSALLRDTATNTAKRIVYAVANDMTGTPIPAEYLSHGKKPGLERFVDGSSTGKVDEQINFAHSNGRAFAANSSHEWRGVLMIPSAGAYRLHLQVLGAFAKLSIDGKNVAVAQREWLHGDITQAGESDVLPATDGLDNVRTELELSAGPHSLSISVTPDTSNNPEQIRLNWVTPEQRRTNYRAAIEAARHANTAIVFVWSRVSPDFGLPGDQDKLIEDVAAVNPKTIVVLNASEPVAMPWLSHVKAVLQMWWPGDEGGWATANVLLGRVSPAGRLPFTWPQRLEDTPVNDPAHPERKINANRQATYSEGIFVGYRWFDRQKIQPLFPFGYGLSYTHFAYSDLKVTPALDGGLIVSFVVKNKGGRASDEVSQAYLGAPMEQPDDHKFVVHALAAFDRIHLAGGQSRTVSLRIRKRSLQYWSTASKQWTTAAGEREVYVGPSSRDLPLSAKVTIHD